MPSVYDSDENLIGRIEVNGDCVIALDIDGRELGRYGTPIEAVSELLPPAAAAKPATVAAQITEFWQRGAGIKRRGSISV